MERLLSPADLCGRPERVTRNGRRLPAQPGFLPISKVTLWRYVREGVFPRPIKLSSGRTVWAESDVDKWLKERVRESA